MLRFAVCAAALLLVAPAHAQIIRSGTGRMVRQHGQSPVLDRYVFAPSGATVTASLRGTPLTVSGPATTVCDPARTPQCWTAPANTAAVGPDGALIYGERTSRLLWNQRSSADNTQGGLFGAGTTWIAQGEAALVGVVEAPDGTMTAEEITVSTYNVNDVRQASSGYAASAQLAQSMWILRTSTSGILRITSALGSVYGDWTVNLALLADEWTRIAPGNAALTVAKPFVATTVGAGGVRLFSVDGTQIQFSIWRPWQQEGPLGPDAEVGANPLSIAAMELTVPIPAGAPLFVHYLDGVRSTLDVSAMSGSLLIGGAGPLGPLNGVIREFGFCRTTGVCL